MVMASCSHLRWLSIKGCTAVTVLTRDVARKVRQLVMMGGRQAAIQVVPIGSEEKLRLAAAKGAQEQGIVYGDAAMEAEPV